MCVGTVCVFRHAWTILLGHWRHTCDSVSVVAPSHAELSSWYSGWLMPELQLLCFLLPNWSHHAPQPPSLPPHPTPPQQPSYVLDKGKDLTEDADLTKSVLQPRRPCSATPPAYTGTDRYFFCIFAWTSLVINHQHSLDVGSYSAYFSPHCCLLTEERMARKVKNVQVPSNLV